MPASITQFYPTPNAAPFGAPTTWRGSWNITGVSRSLASDRSGAPNATQSSSIRSSQPRAAIARWTSEPLAAQTFGGTLDMVLGVNESAADANAFTKVYAFITVGATDAVRGVLLNFEDTTGTEWSTTLTGKGFSSPQALAAIAAQDGDLLVIEFGAIEVAGSASFRVIGGNFGATARFGVNTPLPDLTVGSTATNTHSGYFVFSQAVLVNKPDAATGDVLAGNQELYLYDGTTGALKRRVLATGSQDPAGGCQLVDGRLFLTYEDLLSTGDGTNGQVAEYDPVTLAFINLWQTAPGVGPHAMAANLANVLLTGFVGDGVGATSCGEGSQVADVTYPRTTGGSNTFTASYPARTLAPPTTVVHTLVSAAAFDQPFKMTITVVDTFADNADVQPTFEVGKTGSPALYFGTATFVNNTAGTTYVLEGTILAGDDIIVTQVEAHPNFTATGALGFVVNAAHAVGQTVLSGVSQDRLLDITVRVAQTFADGNGQQPLFSLGETGNLTKYAATSVFTDQPLDTTFTYTGTLAAGKNLIVTATPALGTTSTGAIEVTVMAWGTPVAASYALRQWQPDGTAVAAFLCARELGGSNSADLAADQRTVFYTSVGREVKRFDVVGNVQLADYATLPPATNGEMARGVRILPDQSVLVADVVNIKRLVAGIVTQTYSLGGQADWGTLAIAPDGLSFWAANRADGAVSPPLIAQFDVATGTVLQTITGDTVPDTGGGMCSGGITVIGGFRAATGAPVPGTGTIVVIKVTSPPAALDAFTITAGGGLSPTSFVLHDGESRTFPLLTPSAGYTIAEVPNPDWTTVIVVSNGSDPGNISVASGETVTVTITNTSTGGLPQPGCIVNFPVGHIPDL